MKFPLLIEPQVTLARECSECRRDKQLCCTSQGRRACAAHSEHNFVAGCPALCKARRILMTHGCDARLTYLNVICCEPTISYV